MKLNKIYVLIILLLSFAFTLHKYYISLTEVEFNKEQKSVQMIMSVFLDDLEFAMNDEFNIDAQIENSNETKDLDVYFFRYLQNHFRISINNKKKNYTFIGKEYKGQIVYFYLEINNISSIKTIEVNNTILIKNFPEQRNLVKVKLNGTYRSLFLSKEKHKGLLNF